MHLIEIFLPLRDNEGQPQPRELFDEVRHELTERFGGLTAHSRAPVEGLWKEERSQVTRDELLILEVMADDLDSAWWRAFRKRLEASFKQEEIVMRAHTIEKL